MFVKKYVKPDKTIYIAVICEIVEDSDKPHYINFFITEDQAIALSKIGFQIIDKTKKDK